MQASLALFSPPTFIGGLQFGLTKPIYLFRQTVLALPAIWRDAIQRNTASALAPGGSGLPEPPYSLRLEWWARPDSPCCYSICTVLSNFPFFLTCSFDMGPTKIG